MTEKNETPSKPVCGECTHFLHEDASGDGYCEVLDLLTKCDTRYCGIFFRPIQAE